MSNHSVIEHRANYHFLKVEEDFLAICSFGEQSPHCKAMILAILEHWTNTHRDQEGSDYTYLSLPEWVEQTYECYARNVLITCLKELLDAKLIERRAIVRYDQDTFEYKLNIDEIQARIRALPEKAPKEVKPNLQAYRELQEQKRVQREAERKAKEGSLKINDGVGEKSTASKNKLPPVEKSTASRSKGSGKVNDGSLKSKRNVDTNLTSSSSTSDKDTDGDDAASAAAHTPSQEKNKGSQKPGNKPPAAPAITLSEQEQAFYDLYCSMPWIKIPPVITEKVKELCAQLAPHLKTQQDLYDLRKFMNTKDFFRGKFNLPVVVLAVNDWAMTQEASPEDDPDFVNGKPRKFYSSFDDPTFDPEKSQREEFYPVKPIVTRQRTEADYAASF
jgi:hypothetical protein